MDLKDKLDLCLRLYDKVHFFWNWYAVGMIAIVGWSASSKEFACLDAEWKWLISGVYLVYVLMNVSGLLYSYRLFFAARKDLFRSEPSEDLESVSTILNTMKKMRFPLFLLAIPYALGVVCVLLFIWRAEIASPGFCPP
jgi:hypothetical protein